MKRYRGFIRLVLILIAFTGLCLSGWFLVKEDVIHRPVYRLSADNIIITEKPVWISNDFVAEVLQSSGLDSNGTLFDALLAQKLSQAFSASPWVEEVRQVQLRYPSGANVQLIYRTTVALVEMASQGLYPVDRHGVLLPTDYFIHIAPEKKDDYPRITGIHSTPIGTVGSLWGDPLVHTAAQLAGFLNDVTEKLELAEIIPARETTSTGNRIVCRLRTKNETEILWGGFEPDDSKNEARKKKMLEIAERYHSLDNVPTHFRPIDLNKD